MKSPSDVGMNRTGLLTHPLNAKEMVKGAEAGVPSSPGDESGISWRERLNRQGSPSETVAAGYTWRPGTEVLKKAQAYAGILERSVQ